MGEVITLKKLLDFGYQPINIDKAVIEEVLHIGIDYDTPNFLAEVRNRMIKECLDNNIWVCVEGSFFLSKDVRKSTGKQLPWEV